MSSIFACDLGLNRKTLSRNFFCCFVFHFREIFFNQHWRQMRASLILLFGKTKAFFGKDTARKKTAFLHTLFVENERETSRLKWGAMFFYKVEGHMPKLSSFGRGKKFRPKKSLTSLLHAALQLVTHRQKDVTISYIPSKLCYKLRIVKIMLQVVKHGRKDVTSSYTPWKSRYS